jgi:hypothetical protein
MKRNIMVNLLVDQPFLFIYAGQYTIIKVEITTLEQYYNTHTFHNKSIHAYLSFDIDRKELRYSSKNHFKICVYNIFYFFDPYSIKKNYHNYYIIIKF